MKKITEQRELLVQIVRCIHLKRELSKVNPDPTLYFWRLMYGGLLDLAILNWTKIFGSNAEPTHWKGIVDDDHHEAFRSDLLSSSGLTENEFSEYWKNMKTYRDEAVAHHADSPSFTHYPKLDVALKSCYFYYRFVIKKARELGETKYPDSLEEYCKGFASQTSAVAKLALEATAHCIEVAR